MSAFRDKNDDIIALLTAIRDEQRENHGRSHDQLERAIQQLYRIGDAAEKIASLLAHQRHNEVK